MGLSGCVRLVANLPGGRLGVTLQQIASISEIVGAVKLCVLLWAVGCDSAMTYPPASIASQGWNNLGPVLPWLGAWLVERGDWATRHLFTSLVGTRTAGSRLMFCLLLPRIRARAPGGKSEQ